jgi:hypothetical protein
MAAKAGYRQCVIFENQDHEDARRSTSRAARFLPSQLKKEESGRGRPAGGPIRNECRIGDPSRMAHFLATVRRRCWLMGLRWYRAGSGWGRRG